MACEIRKIRILARALPTFLSLSLSLFLFSLFLLPCEKNKQARLSERNAVELVSKLIELGFLPKEELLHSSNGREFLTRERLRREVKDAVAAGGGGGSSSGRIAGRAPGFTGRRTAALRAGRRKAVDEAERRRRRRWKGRRGAKRGGKPPLPADQRRQRARRRPLLCRRRRRGRGAAVRAGRARSRSQTSARGSLSGPDVMTRVLEGAHSDDVGRRKRAELTRRSRREARGRLPCDGRRGGAERGRRCGGRSEGSRAPCSFLRWLKSLGIDPRVLAGVGGSSGSGRQRRGLASVVEAMLRSGEVRGALRGGGASFAPEIHSRAVAAASAAFYAQEGYVEVNSNSSSSSGGAGAGASSLLLPEGAVLLSPPSGTTTVAVSPALIAQVDAAVEDACCLRFFFNLLVSSSSSSSCCSLG